LPSSWKPRRAKRGRGFWGRAQCRSLKAHEEIEEACLYGPLLDEGPF
jgi:hypothetical protein